MLTEDQIKNLKPGDPLIIHGKFKSVDDAGDIWVDTDDCSIWYSPSCVSLPSEYKTVVDARDIFHNMSEDEKASVNNFLSSYFRETKKQEEMCNALKKMGIDLTNIRPKHAPCRQFKKGDKVQYRERDGRKLFRLQDEAIYEVKSNEGDAGTVEIWLWKEFSRYGSYPYNVFELVTPVEELEPYKLIDSPNTYNIVRDKETVMTIHKKSHPNAKAAAEAECARLNTEYRKEQNDE